MRSLPPSQQVSRSRRSSPQLVGGKTKLSDAVARQYADAVVAQLGVRAGGGGRKLSVQRIESATSQVVAGAKYDIVVIIDDADGEFRCKFSIWSRPWLHKNEVTSKCDNIDDDQFEVVLPEVADDEPNVAASEDRPQAAALVGGARPIGLDAVQVRALVDDGLASIASGEGVAFK